MVDILVVLDVNVRTIGSSFIKKRKVQDSNTFLTTLQRTRIMTRCIVQIELQGAWNKRKKSNKRMKKRQSIMKLL